MRDDFVKVMNVALYCEVETPVPVDAGLPDIQRRIVFLGAKGRMGSIRKEQGDLLVERLPHGCRSGSILLEEPFRVTRSHAREARFGFFDTLSLRASACSEAISSV